jgi:hypothetical protein
MKRATITIDPGYGGTGVAYFLRTSTIRPRPPYRVWNLKGSKGSHEGSIDTELLDAFTMLIRTLSPAPYHAVIELPNLWSGSAKSMASATSGKLFTLTALCGAYAALLWNCWHIDIQFVKPQEWKGQLPKEIVERRVLRAWPAVRGKLITDHVADAVGMGLWLQGGL